MTQTAGADWNIAKCYAKMGNKDLAIASFRSAADRGDPDANKEIVELDPDAVMVPDQL